MITIRCGRCKTKVLRYNKIGKGKTIRCWEDRIQRVYGHFDDGQLKCSRCQSTIGEAQNGYVKMNQSAFTYGGRIT